MQSFGGTGLGLSSGYSATPALKAERESVMYFTEQHRKTRIIVAGPLYKSQSSVDFIVFAAIIYEIRLANGSDMRKTQNDGGRIELDSTDLGIIRSLLPNSRKAVTMIAKEVRVSESTVRNRLKKFAAMHLMEFELTTDPLRFGYSVWAMLEIHVELPKIREVAELIRREPRIHMVGIMSGAYDIFAASVVRSNQELVELIANRLSKISGITRITSSTILEMVKRRTNFGFPELVYENGDLYVEPLVVSQKIRGQSK